MSINRNDIRFRRVMEELKRLRDTTDDEEVYWYYEGLLSELDEGLILLEDAIIEAKNAGVRHPAFEGDFIGYPDDDEDRYSDGYCPKCGMPWQFYHDDDGRCFDD